MKMGNEKEQLLHEYERLDLEFVVLEMIAKELRKQNKDFAADNIDEAREHLYKTILCVKKSWKFLDPNADCEQLVMDIPKS
jgi:hypothetical protein